MQVAADPHTRYEDDDDPTIPVRIASLSRGNSTGLPRLAGLQYPKRNDPGRLVGHRLARHRGRIAAGVGPGMGIGSGLKQQLGVLGILRVGGDVRAAS